MINVQDKQNCCGCSACVQRCPKQCISLHEDEEGFLYPEVDLDVCIDCGLCEKVCPVLHQAEERVPLEVFAAKNPNEQIRMESSSGGVFTQLAELTIEAGGVVFGVKWNEHFEAVHAYTETKEGLSAFRGSKYVQSRVGETFQQTENFLKQGRQVLYVGTPCQIAGLKLFLRKDYDNLLAVDFICHGTPSPGVFRWYMGELLADLFSKPKKSRRDILPISQIPSVGISAKGIGCRIHSINFRDKVTGWKEYSFTLEYSTLISGRKRRVSYNKGTQPFMSGFLQNLYLRPSCYACPAKSGKSNSDLTLGDYWKISSLYPELDDDMGVSSVCCNTTKGRDILSQLGIQLYHTTYEDLCKRNSSIIRACKEPKKRSVFFAQKGRTFKRVIAKLCKPSLTVRTKITLKRLLDLRKKKVKK